MLVPIFLEISVDRNGFSANIERIWPMKYSGFLDVALVTNDMEKTVRFYRDVLGMSVVVTFAGARQDSRGDIVTLSMDGEGATEDLIATAAHEESPMVSPDGRWIAYVSDESGRNEVWARPFPNVDDGRWQISTGGGIMPVWAQDGRELFYQVKENADAPLRLMAAAIETEPTFRHGRPRALFEGPYYAGVMSFDVSSDGERFLMIKQDPAPTGESYDQPELILVENWFEDLTRLVPTP